MKCIGFKHVEGEYQGKSYSHVKLYFTSLIESNGSGYSCDVVKVSNSVFDDFVKTYIQGGDLMKILNLNLDCFYDKYGHVSKIVIIK